MLYELFQNIKFNFRFSIGYICIIIITFFISMISFDVVSLKISANGRYKYPTCDKNDISAFFDGIKKYDSNAKDISNDRNVEKFISSIGGISSHLYLISLLSLVSIFYLPSLFNDFNVVKNIKFSDVQSHELSRIKNKLIYIHVILFQFIMLAWLIPIVYRIYYTGFSYYLIMALILHLTSVIFSSLIMLAVKVNSINIESKCTNELLKNYRNKYEESTLFGGIYLIIIVITFTILIANFCLNVADKLCYLISPEFKQIRYNIFYTFIIIILSVFTYIKYIKNQYIEYLKYLNNNFDEFKRYYDHKFINIRVNLVLAFGYITIIYLPIWFFCFMFGV